MSESMFRINNLNNKNATTVEVALGDRIVCFTIGNLISKRNKEILDNSIQFTFLNSYLDYKGEEFKKGLFDILSTIEENIFDTITTQGIYPITYHLVEPILDWFDVNDVYEYTKVYGIVPPPNLADEFDPLIEKDGRGTRVQTYIKKDYLELVALSTIIKVTLGPVAHYSMIKNEDLGSTKEYMLFHMYRKHKIMNYPAMIKLYGLTDKLLNLPSNTEELDQIRTLSRMLPKDEYIHYMVGLILIQKVAIAPIITDNEDKNIITSIYNYINNKSKISTNVNSSIRNKTALTDSESLSGEKESYVESYRTQVDITDGLKVEYNFLVERYDRVLKGMPEYMRKYIDMNVLKDALTFTMVYHRVPIERIQIKLLATIFKRSIPPQSLDYININGMINLLAVGFAYAWGIGCKHVALLLVSKTINTENEVMTYNSTVNRPRVNPELKEELDKLFPYRKYINETTSENEVENAINIMVSYITANKWICVADDKYIIDEFGDKTSSKLVSPDLKIKLTEFVIKNERVKNEQ